MTAAYIIAGEPSGDRLGGALMTGLSTLEPGISFAGVGGPEMTEQGLVSQFPMAELSVMGIAEVLPKYRALKARIRECAAAILANPPDVLITIDSPDFCLRVARMVRAANPDIRTVHYVAPSVWAWRPGRADKMATVIDQVLCLLPFEPPFMEKAGMRADFVGHPVVADPQASVEAADAFRAEHDIDAGAPLILALPGSRRGEVARLAETFGKALDDVIARHPDARIVVPTTANVADMIKPFLARWPGRPVLLDPRETGFEDFMDTKRAAFKAADIALAASGTVSLELAASDTPMVIAYDMNWLSRLVIGRMLRVDTVTLVNLVTDTRLVPEFLGAACQPEPIARALVAQLGDPEGQAGALALTMERLGRGGEAPGMRAARAVLDGIGRQAMTTS